MSVDTILEEARKVVDRVLPDSRVITKIDLEGAVIVLYTKDMEIFAENNDYVRQLAQGMRKRVAIRPDPSLLSSEEDSEKIIKEVIPKEADVRHIYFEHETGEVTIEAINPGLVIGKQGSLLNELKMKIGWAPKVSRAPPIASKTVEEIKNFLREHHDERDEFLRKVGRKLARDVLESETYIRLTTLGGFRQVGRSCILLTTRESKVLVDCGVDVSKENNGSPYLNAPEVMPLDAIDAIVITHAHLDHSGVVPVLFKYNYDGPVYCTPPTRDLMSLLQLDFIKVAAGEAKKTPYESSHIRKMITNCITLKYGETTDISPDVRLTFQNAGHILGSAIAHFHIGEGLYNIAITGDIKFERTWLFNPAVNKFPRLEALVIESTYGGYHDIQPTRQDAAGQLKDVVERALNKGGHVLVPVFAVGRSQEVMLVLEELMRTKQIPTVPVYLDGLIWEATAIHTAYPEYLNSQLRTQIFQMGDNPFLSEIFKRVESAATREKIIGDPDPCVVLATSGMMNGGPVMEYLKHWADEPKNVLVFVGFQADGTMGRRIQKGLTDLNLNEHGNSITVKLHLDIATVDGFSGHSDRRQLINYIGSMEPRPEKVLCCHGEEHKCIDLASTFYKKFGMETRAPMNLETVRLK